MSSGLLQFLVLSFLLAVFPLGNSADLTCPASPINVITNPNGSFPTGGKLTNFPADYKCGIQFDIPTGFVMKFVVATSTFDDDPFGGDYIVIYDSLMVRNDFIMGETTFYSPANTSTVEIGTYTNTSAFYFTWEYVKVSSFGQFKNPTGAAMKMNLLPNFYYLFTSDRGPITFHFADMAQDAWLSSIYVYDGSDLNAPFMGNLLRLSKDTWSTSGKAMVLVNYYNNSGDSYGIVNDYDAISGFAMYSFWLLTTSNGASVQLGAHSSSPVAATYLCIDSNQVYITSMSVTQNEVAGPQMVTFQPLTPTDNQTILLEYTANQQGSQYMPQQIPGKLFTMIASGCTVSTDFVSGAFEDWSRAVPGRKGTIFSPSRWDPLSPATYTTNFTSNDILTFMFNLESVVIAETGEKIRIEVGSPGTTPRVVQFSQTSQNVGSTLANGTYMSTSFVGTSNKSSFWLSFEIKSADPSPALSTTTTTTPLITTTKASNQALELKFAVLLLAIFRILTN